MQCFRAAIERQPAYAAAYAGLADAFLSLHDYNLITPVEGISQGKKAARQALRIDSDLAEPHISLAHAYFHDFNWASAEREFLRGLQLNPSYATGHFYYSNYLLAFGRTEDAIAAAHRARTLDPISHRARECREHFVSRPQIRRLYSRSMPSARH